jgi:hypothetical protein
MQRDCLIFAEIRAQGGILKLRAAFAAVNNGDFPCLPAIPLCIVRCTEMLDFDDDPFS